MTGTTIRSERDDFIAFSLAAADVLIAVDDGDRIESVVGAAKTLLKGEPEELAGQAIPDIFEGAEAAFIRLLATQAREHGRIEPSVVMLGRDAGDKSPANVGMSYLPGRNRLYMSLTILPRLVVQSLPVRDPHTGLFDTFAFQQIAAGGLGPDDAGSGAEMLKELRLIRLQGLPGVLERMPSSRARTVMGEIGAYLRAQACDGGLAGQLGDEHFGIIAPAKRGGKAAGEALSSHVAGILSRAGADPDAVVAQAHAVALDRPGVAPDEAAKALAYAISEFGKTENLRFGTLSQCLETVIENTLGKVNQVRDLIASRSFSLAYQPIVDILTRDVHHYEALMRFDGDRSPFEMITFSEKVGLHADLDVSVLETALVNMRDHPDEKIAVNISGSSLEQEAFRARMIRLLGTHKAYAGQLMIEVTESAMVEDMEPVAAFLADLRRRGHFVCLDDFGAGANAYNYLRRFDADFVKIDGPFLKAAVHQDRQRALVKSVALLCHDLGIRMIGEMIESESMAQAAASLGIAFGQGYAFGKPEAHLANTTQNLKRQGLKRLGESETWQ
jgi:EAL domain-containing protein (putative c-di-GMP-specific phosphodiesterase class I)